MAVCLTCFSAVKSGRKLQKKPAKAAPAVVPMVTVQSSAPKPADIFGFKQQKRTVEVETVLVQRRGVEGVGVTRRGTEGRGALKRGKAGGSVPRRGTEGGAARRGVESGGVSRRGMESGGVLE